jgi:hypothetical protein
VIGSLDFPAAPFIDDNLADVLVDSSISSYQMAVDLNDEDEEPGHECVFSVAVQLSSFAFKYKSNTPSYLDASIQNLLSATELVTDDHPLGQKLCHILLSFLRLVPTSEGCFRRVGSLHSEFRKSIPDVNDSHGDVSSSSS